MEGVPQNSSMDQPEVQFYLERVSNLEIDMYVSYDQKILVFLIIKLY